MSNDPVPAKQNQTNQLSLLTWSPYPGVSTMFSLSLTPFSTITVEMNQVKPRVPSAISIHSRTTPLVRPGLSDEVHLGRRLTMGDGMNFRCLSDLFVRSEPTFRINQVRREERVDQCRFSQTSLTCATNRIAVRTRQESSATDFHGVQEGYAPTTITLNWKPLFKSLCSI